jgi:serine phosphatase RsbU (regulator of sigma subunit)
MNTFRSILNHILGQPTAVLNPASGQDRSRKHRASARKLHRRSVGCRKIANRDREDAGIIPQELSDRRQSHADVRSDQNSLCTKPIPAIRSADLVFRSELQRLNHDLTLAEQVQRRLLPQLVPVVPSFEFFARYVPAHEISGDFYDFIRLPDDRLAVVVGDVSGSGVAAGLLMARFSCHIQHLMLAGYSPPTAAKLLNELLFEAGIDEAFITLSLSVLEIKTRTLSLISAGHPLLTIRRADGTVDKIGEAVGGFPLGIVPDADYQQIDVALHPGDVVAVFSDGVTDARNQNEELYDSRKSWRLLDMLAKTRGSPQTVGRAILEDISDFSSGHTQADDLTLICFGPIDR